MTIRLLSHGDLPALMRLKASAGWNQTEDDWLRLLRVEPGGCFGVESGGDLVASATVVRYGATLAWIGMVLTLPEYRGRGLARQLMVHSMEYARGCTVRLDASDMGKPLYLSLGFVEECYVERRVRPPGKLVAGPALDRARVDMELDRSAFGADRSLLLRQLERYETAGAGASSYAFARPGSDFHYFGPCVASSDMDFRALLGWCVARHPGGAVAIDLFPHHEHAPRIAAEFGFEPRRRLTRMVLRPHAPELPDPRVYAIAGFEFG